MPEPSFGGHRRYGFRTMGPLALLLHDAGPALAGAATVRNPARALRSTLEARG